MPLVLTFLFMTPSFQCITFYQNWIRLLVFLLIFQFLLSSAILIEYPPQTHHSCISYVLPNRLLGSSDGKESTYNVEDAGLIPGSGRSSGEGKGNSLQYSCLKHPMDRGAWRATAMGSQRVRHNLATKEQQVLCIEHKSKPLSPTCQTFYWHESNLYHQLPPLWTLWLSRPGTLVSTR